MTSTEDHARTIFLAALERAPDQWVAFLDKACGGDAGLRARVDQLLHAHQAMGSIHGGHAAATAAATVDAPPREAPGTIVGPYKLLEQIGEGGFGVVFLADQTHPVRRKVALKVLKPGMDTRQVVARFEAERQALAIMDHPNIAKVLDGGATASGRPFFVMELVKGVPVTEFCDQNHLTPRQRLELFIPVCQAVQHAHQKGIIHRDLKPSNVMVTVHDTTPVVKVIDFGVAKALGQELTDKTLFTSLVQMVGTPLYMSPEQAGQSGLDVDTRSDIYSLGVLLYELLTGTTPFDGVRFKRAAHDEIRRIIREEEPPKPSTRLSDLGRSGAPGAAGGTSSSARPAGPTSTLASVSAMRHTEPAKLTKLVRGELDWIVMRALEKDRNRRYETASGFAADVQRYLNDEAVQACPPSATYRFRKFARRNKRALASAAVLALAVLVVAGTLGWAVRDRGARAQVAAGERAARQTAVEQEVGLALREAEQLQQQAKWPEALSAAKRAEGLLAGGGGDELRERARQVRKDLEMVLRLEEIPLLSSEWKHDKFDYETAHRAYAQAFADYGIDVAGLPAEEAAARLRARPGVAVALAAALDDWALNERAKGKAGRLALTALAQAADPDPWRRQVRQAVQQKDSTALVALAASPELLRQPPTTLAALARALRARDLVEPQIEVLRQAQRQYPGDFWINFHLAEALRNSGPSYRAQAVSFLRAALAVRPRSIATHLNLGRALSDQVEVNEAIACYRKAIDLDPKFVRAHINLGRALSDQGKLDQAIVCYRKGIELDPKYANAHCCLGDALRAQGKLDEAVASYRKAIELDPKPAIAHYNLGFTLHDQGKLDEAIAEYRKAIELDPKDAMAYTALGGALLRQNQLPEALAACHKAIELNPKDATAYNNLGGVFLVQKKLPEALAALHKAIELNPKHTLAYPNLALVLSAQGKPDEAIAAFRKAIELDPKHADAHSGLGHVLNSQGKVDESIAAHRKAVELDPKSDYARTGLGTAVAKKGWHLADSPDPKLRDPKRALDAVTEGVELAPLSIQAWAYLGWVQYRAGNWKASVEALEKSCELEKGGDAGQWIVLAMAHAKLAAQEGLPENEREHHKAEARRRYDQAVKQIDGWWRVRPDDDVGQAIWDFRAEAGELMGVKEKPK